MCILIGHGLEDARKFGWQAPEDGEYTNHIRMNCTMYCFIVKHDWSTMVTGIQVGSHV